MGYPMSWKRLVARNRLEGGYVPAGDGPLASIRGDMRRLEADSLDAIHVPAYARLAGVTEEQAATILRAFFEGGAWAGITAEQMTEYAKSGVWPPFHPIPAWVPDGG